MDSLSCKAKSVCFWSIGYHVHHKNTGCLKGTYSKKRSSALRVLNAIDELMASAVMETRG